MAVQFQCYDTRSTTAYVCHGKIQHDCLTNYGQAALHGHCETPNRGVIHGGDDTDMGQEEEEAEEEEANEDNIFAPEVSDMEQVLSTFRNKPNVCLEREEWNDAVIFQHGLMRILNAVWEQ